MKKIPLKIIAGRFKNKTIYSYSESTRETAHMIRGSVFNMLFQVHGIGLDLFAGSGAYGFEGLSRGLSQVYLNDKDKLAYKALLDNQKILNTEAIITNEDYVVAIQQYKQRAILFDYIFLDPPYDMDISSIIERVWPLLNHEGMLICEIKKDQDLTTSYEPIKDKKHGIKRIIIYKKNSHE